jgi:hypothetical protein
MNGCPPASPEDQVLIAQLGLADCRCSWVGPIEPGTREPDVTLSAGRGWDLLHMNPDCPVHGHFERLRRDISRLLASDEDLDELDDAIQRAIRESPTTPPIPRGEPA